MYSYTIEDLHVQIQDTFQRWGQVADAPSGPQVGTGSGSGSIAARQSRLRTLEEEVALKEVGQLGTLEDSKEAMEYLHLQLETLVETKEAIEAEVPREGRAHKRAWLGWQALEEGEPTPREAWGDAPTRALLYNREER